MVVPTRPYQERMGLRLLGERSRASKQTSIGFIAIKLTCCFTTDAYVSNHSLGVDIAVEVISKTLVDDKFVSVIDYNEPGAELLARAWPGIRHTVFSTLEEYDSTKGCTTAISLLRLGYDRFDTSQNPRTVYITLDYNSSGYGWPPVLRRLQHYVDSFHMGLVVHMEHNLVDDVSFPFLQTNLLSLERDVLQEKHGVGSRDPYSKELKQGDAIGATLYLERSDERLCNPQIGTLGCWVEVKLKKENDWVKMGLSCYHILRSCLPGFRVGTYTINVDGSDVVRGRSSHPELNTSCWKADEEGIFPSSASDLPEMEHPPRMRHNINIADLEEAIAKAISRNHGPSRIAMWEEELAEKKKFFDEGSQKFGRPYFASGYLRRTSTGGRLDWALIKPDDDNRIAGNPLPAMGTFLERGYKRSEMPWEDSTLKSQGKSIRDYVKDGTLDTCSNNILNACSNNILDACSNNKLDTCSHDELLGYKQGAATGSTVGKLSVVKTFCSIEEEKHLGSRRYSIEYIFCGAQATPTRSFTGQGDAGAVVYDQEGRILGIVFRGQMPQQSKQGYTMVTPIEDVFEDIKTMSKGEVEDIRVLGSA
jgi:hypothetical protein